ncbi:MAG: phage tail protein [Synechococcaceae cyanobacterium]|jgi:phage tail-like protein
MVSPHPTEVTSYPLGLPMTHRFGVAFFHAGRIPNPIDVRFTEISGLAAKITTINDPTSAPTLSASKVPTGIEYGELTLRRGVVIGSPVAKQVEAVFRSFKFFRSDILVTIFSEIGVPTGAWLFNEAFPVEWQLADLNAMEESVLVESLMLAYSRLRWITL